MTVYKIILHLLIIVSVHLLLINHSMLQMEIIKLNNLWVEPIHKATQALLKIS